MPTKAATKTMKEKKVSALTGKYFYGVGRRKTATAQVRLYPAGKDLVHMINHKPFSEYFPETLRGTISTPLTKTGLESEFIISATVRGGGTNAQAEAVRLGTARALLIKDEALRTALRAEGFLTRDARSVERKKPGFKKARRSPQWSKR
jgi:small subunit ribosomal protein S9